MHKSYLKYFLYVIGTIVIIEGLLLLHAWIDSYHFSDINGSGVFTIWAAVLTIVFLVFSIMGLLNIDNRIKDLNDTKKRLLK